MIDRVRRFAGWTKRFVFSAALAASLLPAPARANCLLDYASCVETASELDSFGRRSLAGLQCYVGLLSCLQRRLI